MGKFGANPYAAPAAAVPAPQAAPAIPAARPAGRFGSNPYSGLLTPTGQQQTLTAGAVLQSARAKLKAGQTLTLAESQAVAAVEGDKKALGNVAIALQPLFALSDVVKGVASDVKDDITTGQPFTHTAGGNAGMSAALAHVTYGLSEYAPGMAGAREHGVTGMDLLKGTKYEGNAKAALVVELLSDPTIVLTGAGLAAKAGAMSVKLAQGAGFLDRIAASAEGAEFLRSVVQTADKAGSKFIHLADAATGVPAVARVVAGSGFGKAVGKAVGDFGQTTLSPWWQDKLNVRTIADGFFTPDVKRAVFTPAQQQVQAFRDTQTIAKTNTTAAIVGPAQKDIQTVAALTKGLNPADSREALRLFTVATTATDPAVTAEVLRKLNVIGTRTGKNLETPFVAAVKAANNIRNDNLGNKLADLGLPAVTDPAVNKAYQDAVTGQDIVNQTGRYTTADGRPVGILPTQYKGRGDVDETIAKLNAAPATAARVSIDPPKVSVSLENAASTVDVPARPLPPVGRAPDGAPPLNSAETAERVTARATPDASPAPTPRTAPEDPAASAAPAASPAALTPPTVRGPADVLDELYGSGAARKAPDVRAVEDPANVVPPRTAEATPAAPLDPPARAAPEPDAAAPAPRAADTAPIADPVVDVTTPPAAPVNSAADLSAGLSDMGGGISDSLHDMLYGKYVAGDVTELGQPSNVLLGAQQLQARGVDLTREQWPDFAGQFSRQLTDTAGLPDRQAQLQKFLGEYEPPSTRPAPAVDAPFTPDATPASAADAPSPTTPDSSSVVPVAQPNGPADLLHQLLDQGALGVPTQASKTPAEIVMDLVNQRRADPLITPQAAITRTEQDVSKDVGLHVQAPDRTVTKTVPTTYRTVQVDSSAIDWASLPDRAARREVANTIGNGFALKQTADGRWVPNKAAVTLPLDHPVVSRYFDNQAIEGARFGGDSGYGELLQNTRQQVPHWYNPKDPAPLDVQRATHEAEQAGRAQAAYPNDYARQLRNMEALQPDALDRWLIGDAFAADLKAGKPPLTPVELEFSANSYAQRVAALNGSLPTPAEVFRYRMQLARTQQAQRLRNLSGSDVTTHLKNFFDLNPEATLYEATLDASRAFGLGRNGAKLMREVLAREESGFLRQMSTLERKEFAQYIKGRDATVKGGGDLTGRLLRNPEAVSQQFLQVFPQELNAIKLLNEEVRTRGAAIVQAQALREYQEFLVDTGQHITAKQLAGIRFRPLNQLTPEERALRESIGSATEQAGAPAGWKIMDRNAGPFEKGDAVPWWAYHDLFGASSVQDAAVSRRILDKGGLTAWQAYKRANTAVNANLLSSLTSIVNDQLGVIQQMHLWGIAPTDMLNGMLRRAAAATNPEGAGMLRVMREQGLSSAKLESNLSADGSALEHLARRMEGESDMGHLQRVMDGVLRFREYATGLDRGALTNPLAKVAANVTHRGSGYVFEFRSALADLQRESLYFHYLSEGRTPVQAAAETNHVLMDMRLAPAITRVVGHFWSFFRWTAMAAPRSILTVLRRPASSSFYQRIGQFSDTPTDDDGRNDARRVLARDGGYVNTGMDERNGTRIYLDGRGIDIENTIPQLLDFSGTKVGSVGLPWIAQLVSSVGWGLDRNGNPVYSAVLGGQSGGFFQAYHSDPKRTLTIAAKTVWNLFQPSYAPGSTRAVNLANSVLETAKLPEDGSHDIALAKLLTETPWGQAGLRYMQQGEVGILMGTPLTGNRGSPYSNAPASMARAALSFALPLRGVNADPAVQGDAQQQLSVGQLDLGTWVSAKTKEIDAMRAAGAPAAQVQTAVEKATLELNQKRARLMSLYDLTNR